MTGKPWYRVHGGGDILNLVKEIMFKVQKKACDTCIYRKDSNLDIAVLEDQVSDKYMGFKGHRICHHSKHICCQGFWNRHKNDFPLGQIAQRLGMVDFVNHDPN